MIPMFDYYKKRHNLHSSDEIKPGLTAIKAAIALVNQPQLHLPTIHIAGTNGKGSTLKMLERLLQTHGLKTATFMSPCIEDVHDQIQFDGQPITQQQMDEAFIEAAEAGLDKQLTDFELLTAIAFIAIKQQKPDIALIESGLGGRYDSTNIIRPLVSIIPSIALEHTAFLGNTLAEIAGHKAGIIKNQTPVIIGKLPEQAERVIQEEATQQQAPIYMNGRDFSVTEQGEWSDSRHTFVNLNPSLVGAHQSQNMALAIKALTLIAEKMHITLNQSAVQQAVATTHLAGRFEKIAHNIWIDGAHNPASARTLRQTVQQLFPQQPITIVLGILKDKDIQGVLTELEQISDDFIFVRVEREQGRLMEPSQLIELSKAHKKRAANSVVDEVEKAAKNNIVIVTGSLYLLAQWRSVLQQHFTK